MKVREGTTQAKVLAYLKTGHSLDLAKAISLFGYIRLSCAIEGLRKKGYKIITESVKGPQGNVFTFYRLNFKVTEETPVGTIVKVRSGLPDVEEWAEMRAEVFGNAILNDPGDPPLYCRLCLPGEEVWLFHDECELVYE